MRWRIALAFLFTLIIGTFAYSTQLTLTGAGIGTTAAPKVLTFQTSANDGTAQTTYNFTSQTFGTASSGRCIIVGSFGAPTGANPAQAISSATIGGISATTIGQINGGANGDANSGILIAAVPTGTTGTVAITFGGTMARAAIAIWAVTGLANCTTANDHGSSTGAIANVMSLTLNTLTNGFAIGFASENADDGATNWVNATSRIDSSVGGARYTGGDNASTSSPTTLISVSPFSSSHRAYTAASW